MNKILLGATLIALVTIIGISYFSIFENQSNQSVKVTVAVTKDFGKELMLQEKIIVASGTSALDATKKIANVETSYGGGFVSSINNIKSAYPEKQYDWFFYVNGFLSKEGASNYKIVDGDFVTWDYHSWESFQFQSAILGAYPKYLINGYGGKNSPTIVVYEDQFYNQAHQLKKKCKEQYGLNVEAVHIDKISEKTKSISNVIIFAKPNNKLVVELNEMHQKLGYYAVFKNNTLNVLNDRGGLSTKYDQAGIIQISQNVWNPKGTMACENVILVVSGTDEDSITTSVNIMIRDIHRYRYSFGLIILDSKIRQIP